MSQQAHSCQQTTTAAFVVAAHLVEALLKQGRQPAVLLHRGAQVAATRRLLLSRQHHANAAGTHRLAHLHQVKEVRYHVRRLDISDSLPAYQLNAHSTVHCPSQLTADLREVKDSLKWTHHCCHSARHWLSHTPCNRGSRAPARKRPLQCLAQQSKLTVSHFPCYKQHLRHSR